MSLSILRCAVVWEMLEILLFTSWKVFDESKMESDWPLAMCQYGTGSVSKSLLSTLGLGSEHTLAAWIFKGFRNPFHSECMKYLPRSPIFTKLFHSHSSFCMARNCLNSMAPNYCPLSYHHPMCRWHEDSFCSIDPTLLFIYEKPQIFPHKQRGLLFLYNVWRCPDGKQWKALWCRP